MFCLNIQVLMSYKQYSMFMDADPIVTVLSAADSVSVMVMIVLFFRASTGCDSVHDEFLIELNLSCNLILFT